MRLQFTGLISIIVAKKRQRTVTWYSIMNLVQLPYSLHLRRKNHSLMDLSSGCDRLVITSKP